MPRPTTRIPLNTLAVPFGLAGFAETWTYAAPCSTCRRSSRRSSG
ncbi:hypothetical protein Q7F20_02295 [Curtobacterium sp. A7_M15]|nr:hypothetical protein [Curtobacterium sp. A7_M15]MDP4332188.1 hypothetical protein [Curtobacterium sp. A7_M15]